MQQSAKKATKVEKGYIPLSSKGRPKNAGHRRSSYKNNRIVELEMKVELLQNFLSEMWKDVSAKYRVIERFKGKISNSEKCASLFEVSRKRIL